MPTQLPDIAARARHQRRRRFAKFAPIVAALLYLLLLAWNMATFEGNVSVLFGRDPGPGEYNPMEPGHRTAAGPRLPIGWLARR
jgi:hypothetical protein